MEVENRLAEIRGKRGYAAAELARQAGVSRQTIYAMEAGSYVPNTAVALRLARALEVTVEELFSLRTESGARVEGVTLLEGAGAVSAGQPVRLCRVGRRLVAAVAVPSGWCLPVGDAVVVDAGARPRVELFAREETRVNRLLIAGCDPGISVLAHHAARAGVELVTAHRNSSESLKLLAGGLIHIAGSHLRDDATGESNLPSLSGVFRKGSIAVVSFAVWEEGLVVASGNPKSIRGVEDLARRDVTIVNREIGAGSRLLLDSRLRRAGVEPGSVRGYERTARGHLPAASLVLAGAADCAVATRAAARAFGLDFIPLASERYDLVLRKNDLKLPPVETLLDVLSRAALRRELESAGGYDTSVAGQRVL